MAMITCPNCGEQNYHHYEYPQANGGYNRYLQDGFSGEFIFENIDIYTDKVDDNGREIRHNFTLIIKMINGDGNYEPLCSYKLYDGKTICKNVEYKVKE